jgi:hypothetical protein
MTDREHTTQEGMKFTIEPVEPEITFNSKDIELMAREILNTGMNPQLVSDLQEQEIKTIWEIINGRQYTR